MNLVRRFLITPVGIAIALTHWAVVAFAMFGDQAAEYHPNGTSTTLMYFLLLIDFPALLIGTLVGNLSVYLLGENWSSVVYSVANISAATLYWLLIGSFLQIVIAEITQVRRQLSEVSIK